MNLRARVNRLDDYAGELTRTLEKLEMEQARGALDRDQQADFLADLKAAVAERDLKPMRNRALLDLLIAGLTLGMALALPSSLNLHNAPLLILLALCTLTLVLAAWRFRVYLQRRRHDLAWLGRLEAAVAAGGTLFDAK